MSLASLLEMNWDLPAGVRAACTTRLGGVSAPPWDSFNLATHVGDSPEDVAANRAKLRQLSGLAAEPAWLEQVHGTEVADLDAMPERGIPATADAATTSRCGLACVILVADCLPVLLTTDDGSRVAAAHAGWRGLAAGVLERTIAAMRVPGGRLRAWLGPAISQPHFEVGDEVRAEFLKHDSVASVYFERNARGRWQADLRGLAQRRLQVLGVSNIAGDASCTFADRGRFYSHRRDGRSGRIAAMIWRLEHQGGRS